MTQNNTSKRRTLEALKDHMSQVAESLKVSGAKLPSCYVGQMPSMQIERINERELTSIYALLSYVSYNQNVNQETVQMILEAELSVDHVAKITRQDYMRAVEFLVDVKMGEVIN